MSHDHGSSCLAGQATIVAHRAKEVNFNKIKFEDFYLALSHSCGALEMSFLSKTHRQTSLKSAHILISLLALHRPTLAHHLHPCIIYRVLLRANNGMT